MKMSVMSGCCEYGWQYSFFRGSLVVQMVRNLPAMWETQVQSLGWEDLLEEEMATHSSILAQRIPWTAARQASMSITNFRSLLKLMSIESVMPSNHLILCHPLVLLPSIFPSIGVFFNELALHIRWPKHWSFSFSISPSNEHPGLISCKMDWLDLLAVQGTLKSLLQHHSSKASILRHSAFFMVQLSHPYMTTGETILKCCHASVSAEGLQVS